MSCSEDSSPTLRTCIVWGNAPDSVCGVLTDCLTDGNPLFVRPGEWVDCGSPVEFQRGDANADADNKDGVNVTDVVFLLSFLFQGGELPPAPFPDCGWDWDIDELTCASYAPCE